MLARIASKRTSNSLLPLAKTGFRGERSQHSSSDNSSGGTSWVKIGAIGTVAIGSAVGGTVYFASTNEENREKVEKNVPYSNLLLNTILGPSTAQSYEVKSTVPKKKPQQVAESVENLKTVVTAPVFKPEKETAVKPDLPSIQKSKKDATTIVPVDVHKPVIEKSAPTPDAVVVANERLKERLPAAIKDAESKVKTAREAKIKTIQAINDHSKALKQAVDDGQSANWTAVSDALTKMEKSTSNDIAEERDARNYIDNLRKVISDAKENVATKHNPLVIMGLETAAKLSSQLDELNTLAQKSRNESRILNQYKDLIDKSRQQFSQELKSILPDIDVHAKESKLSEDELNALIAHAHLRVDQLRRQLTEQQLREEQNIARAIEEQRDADQRIAEEMLNIEARRLKEQNYVDVEKRVFEQREKWETELEDRLRRAQAAHSDHLEQVLRTQKQLYDIEHAQAIEEAVTKERHFHSKTVELALAKLEGIETALQSRAAADEANRRCKLYSIAVQNLLEFIEFGQKAGTEMDSRRKPLNKELDTIKGICESDDFVQGIISQFSDVSLNKGVYTEEDLKTRFEKVYDLGYATARIDDNGGGPFDYLLSWIQSKFMFDYLTFADKNDQIDENNPNPYEILSKARYFVRNGDFATAIRLAQQLRGEPRLLARSWIEDARTHLETRLLAEILAAHAAIVHIRTIY